MDWILLQHRSVVSYMMPLETMHVKEVVWLGYLMGIKYSGWELSARVGIPTVLWNHTYHRNSKTLRDRVTLLRGLLGTAVSLKVDIAIIQLCALMGKQIFSVLHPYISGTTFTQPKVLLQKPMASCWESCVYLFVLCVHTCVCVCACVFVFLVTERARMACAEGKSTC